MNYKKLNLIKSIFKRHDRKRKKQEAIQLSEFCRKNVFDEEALKHLKTDDFESLNKISMYAYMGRWTAIEAAFCMGYEAGKDSATE